MMSAAERSIAFRSIACRSNVSVPVVSVSMAEAAESDEPTESKTSP